MPMRGPLTAALGLSDRNEASWTQVLDVVEFMTDHVDVPILLDGGTRLPQTEERAK